MPSRFHFSTSFKAAASTFFDGAGGVSALSLTTSESREYRDLEFRLALSVLALENPGLGVGLGVGLGLDAAEVDGVILDTSN